MNQEQLPLGFILRDDATFDNYISESNQQALDSILKTLRSVGDNFLYFWGADGCGRSHLLQAICHATPEFSKTAVYLPLQELAGLSPDVFSGLENLSLVCIDDVSLIAGKPIWEEQLFHLFNRLRSKGNCLIVTADVPPAQLSIKLADLKSRLAWGTVYQLTPLSDEQKLTALKLRAQERGLDLDTQVGNFLLNRCPRNMTQLFETLEQLDQASLAQQRRLTIPFVKEVLGV